MSVFTSSAPITVDGWALNQDVDANGCSWIVQEFPGWHAGSGVNLERVQRVVNHGEFGLNGHRTGRAFDVVGALIADSRGPVFLAIEKLSSLLADGGLGLFEFTDTDGGYRWANVQLAEQPDLNWLGLNHVLYRLPLLSPSPYKFGATSSANTGFYTVPDGVGLVFNLFDGTSPGNLDFNTDDVVAGIATVTNPGTAPASVVLTVAGPTPDEGFVIVDQQSGNRITWLGDVIPAGSSVVFDGRDGTVVIDAVADRSGDAIISAWPTVPAGGSADFLFTTDGDSSTASVLTAAAVATYW